MIEPINHQKKIVKKKYIRTVNNNPPKKRVTKKVETIQPRKPRVVAKTKKRRPPVAKQATKKMPVKEKSPVLSLALNLLFYGFILFIVIGSAIFGMSKDNSKSVLGYRTFGVLTDSMVPRDKETQKGGFASGDIIIVQDINGDEAEIGDIITFRPNVGSSAFLTHRVKEKLDQLGETKGVYYITQGDANEAEDVPISAEQVVGKKVFMIPKVGGILNFIRENILVSSVFLISVFGFITILRYYFF